MRPILAALALTAPLWAQQQGPASPEAEIRKIQAFLTSDQGTREEGLEGFKARHNAQFERVEALVSAHLIGEMNASPGIKADELRKRLGDFLGTASNASRRADDMLPWVFRADPPFGRTGPSAFWIVYEGDSWNGTDGARVVVESYVLDGGKAKLTGRLGGELDGVRGGVTQVGADELLIQGLVTWSSGANLPYKAALYRVSESGVSLVWTSGMLRGMSATVFGQYLLVNYVDYNAPVIANAFTWALDVYSLDNGVPNLVFRREH